MRCFLVEPHTITDGLATLSENESRHITSVLRLQSGEPVELFDGSGVIYQGSLESVSKKNVTVRIQSKRDSIDHSGQPLVLCQSLLKGKKMDLLVQKATEMGVQIFQPVLSRYSESSLPSARQAERWNRIMLEACKQCRRAAPMIIRSPAKLEAINLSDCDTRILFWEEERTASVTPDHLAPSGSICLAFGPEGGFHPEEISLYRHCGFQTVSMGSLIMRAETATIAGIAIVRYLSGAFQAPVVDVSA